MRARSLTFQTLGLASLWALVALVAIAVVISTLYRQSVSRGFKVLLRAQLYNVVNSISVGEDGNFAGRPELGDLRFSRPQTGCYWIVEPLGTFAAAPLVSPSLGGTSLPFPSAAEVPFDSNYERFYSEKDAAGNTIQVAETEVVLDQEGKAARFRVSGNLDVVENDIRSFTTRLYLALAVFGFGSLIVNALAILYSLRPLERARIALEKIRGGEAERIEGDYPREIQPLANEINALIESNRRIVERARMQVGNLAHSLKTPIAVLLNEARVLDENRGQLIKGQAEAMQAQVQSYLNRARIAAQSGSVLARSEAEPVLERLVRVMRRLNPDKEIELVVSSGLTFAMEQQDVEETVGNLLENAARHAQSRVILTAQAAPAGMAGKDEGRKTWILVTVEDDGPGLDPEQIREAMKRGRRLDESRPGTGLGLSIVSEITGEYMGSFALARSANGGLLASLVLPGLSKEVA